MDSITFNEYEICVHGLACCMDCDSMIIFVVDSNEKGKKNKKKAAKKNKKQKTQKH
jgi:hypothetical protein